MHHCWHREDKTDLSVFRADAQRRLVDTRHPEETIIHHHPHGLSCGRYEHEEYHFPEQKDTTEEQGMTDRAAETILGLAEMQSTGLTTWNDENHDA